MRISPMHNESGFTLVEMMVTMAIGLFLLSGMSLMFVSQTKTAQSLNQRSEVMNDLFLASQLMQAELRGAKAICWEAGNKRLRYQPYSSAVDLVAACATSNDSNGLFQLRASNNINKPTAYVCWDRPNDNTNCQELMREMKDDVGVAVLPTDNAAVGALRAVRTITLTSQYSDKDGQTQDLSLSFKVWPRNKQ